MNVFDLYASLSLDTKNYENELNDAETKGSKFGSGLAKATKIGATAVASLGATVVGSTAAFVKATGSVAEYGDHIDKASQKMGISAKAYQEWDAVLQHSGASIDSLLPSMKTLSAQAQKGNDAFQQLGISQEEVATLSKEDLFARTIAGLQQMEEGTERTAIASKLLGRGATELGALLNTSAEDTQKMKDTVNELGGVLSDDAVKAAAEYQDSLQDMQTAMSGAKNQMLANFLPGVSQVMKGLTSLFSGNSEGVNAIGEGIQAISTKLVAAIPKIAEAGGQILKGLTAALVENAPLIVEGVQLVIQQIVDTFPEIVQLLTALIPEVVNALMELLPSVVEMGMQLLNGLIDGITQALPVLLEKLPGMLEQAINAILAGLPKILEMASKLIVSLADGLLKALPKLIAKLPQIINGIVTTLLNSIPLIIDTGVKLLEALIEDLPEIITELVKAIPQIINGLVKALINSVPKIAKAGFDLLVSLVKSLPSIIVNIVKSIPDIIKGIVDGFLDGVSDMADVGKDLIKGLWNGISNAKDWIMDKIGGFASGIVKGIKGFFGIHSPSKVFQDEVGKMLGLGLAEGIEDSVDDVDKAMEDLMSVPDNYSIGDGDIKVAKSVEVTNNQNGLLDKIQMQLDAIAQLLPGLANANIVLDTGALVGQTVGAYNEALGVLMHNEERSI